MILGCEVVVIMNMVLVHRGRQIEKSYFYVLSIIVIIFEIEALLKILFMR